MANQRIHKVSKGETLISIAKRYKHKDWRNIWKDPANAAVLKKRKMPEKIEPGDKLVIPMNEAERKQMIELQRQLIAQLQVELDLAQTLSKRADKAIRASENAQKLCKSTEANYQDIIKDLKASAAGAKKWGDNVDVAAEIATLMVSLGKIAKLGKAASTASGEALKKINKEAMDEAVGMAYDPAAKEARKAGAKYLLNKDNEISSVGIAVGVVSESWDKMTSPSFWAWTAIKLWEGEGWSKAVTFDFQKDIKNKIYLVDKQRIFSTKKLLLRAQEASKQAKTLLNESKAALVRADKLQKELDALPAL